MKQILIMVAAMFALSAVPAAAKPLKEAAKQELEDAIDQAEKDFPSKPDPMNPKPEPTSFKGRTKQALKDEFGPLVRQKINDHKEGKGPQELSPDDKGFGAGSSRGQPKIPSQCAESAACRACYESAQADLKHLRFSLEKLRVIGSWTRKFTDKSIAFGDSVSGVHGVAGLGWQPERARIQESYEQFGKAYDSKYEELIGDLEGALREVGQCEAKHFKTADWYDRYGFIYYTFMADRYRRDD